jgi:hypothetical protein
MPGCLPRSRIVDRRELTVTLLSKCLSSAMVFLILAAVGCERSVMSPPPGPEAATNSQLARSNAAGAGEPTHDIANSSRHVISTADICLVTDNPEATGHRVSALAEAQGGFVLSSDTADSTLDDGDELVTVIMTLRVPVKVFDSTLESLRALGRHVVSEKVIRQDVTEEYVDLDSRLKARRAVENQYMAVLKDATTIHDILEVEQKLGDVRTEIERAEGRQRYLDSQTNLSSITLHLAHRIEAITARGPGFYRSLRLSAHDAFDTSVTIINGAIRTMGVLVPICALVGLPGWLFGKWMLRRRRKRHPSEAMASRSKV